MQKTQNILLVCHSTGDTNVAIDVARQLISKLTTAHIHIFAVGQAAARQLTQLSTEDTLTTSKQVKLV